MGFIQTIKYCFQNYRNIKGRAIRSEFWYFTGFLFITTLIAIPLYYLINGTYIKLTGEEIKNDLYVVITLLGMCQIIVFIPLISVLIRRLHDINLPTWVIFPVFIIFISASPLFMVMTLPASSLLPFMYMSKILPTEYTQAVLIISQILTIGSIGLLCLPGTRGDNKFGPEPTITSNKPENIEIELLLPIKTMTYLLKSNTKHERITIRHLFKIIFLFFLVTLILSTIILIITSIFLLYYYVQLGHIKQNLRSWLEIFILYIFLIIAILVLALISSMCIFGPRTMDILRSRFRDANLNDKYFLAPIIASYITLQLENSLFHVISIFYLLPLIAYCIPGTKGPNRYGPDPRQPAPAETE